MAQYLDEPAEAQMLLEYWRPDFSNAHVDLFARFVLEQRQWILQRPSTFSPYLQSIDEPLIRWVAAQLPALNEAIMYDPHPPRHWHDARKLLESIQNRLS